jgi:DNA repair protein RadC
MPAVELIRDLPPEERPRERLLEQGSAALSDVELVAVLLRTGRKGASAVQVATELLREHGGLAGLARLSPRELRRKGIGAAKTASLIAVLEIARRLARAPLQDREVLSHPSAVAHYLALRYGGRDQEVMGALFLDARNRLMGEREIFRGTLDRTAAEPREILKECLLRGAAGVLVFHNHPSGDPSPSPEDVVFTRRLRDAAELLGIRLVDHLVLGAAGRWVSLRERGAC